MGERLESDHEAESRLRHDRQELIMFLERDQLVLDKSESVPRASFGARAQAGLWALRIFALLMAAMVLYTFISQLAA